MSAIRFAVFSSMCYLRAILKYSEVATVLHACQVDEDTRQDRRKLEAHDSEGSDRQPGLEAGRAAHHNSHRWRSPGQPRERARRQGQALALLISRIVLFTMMSPIARVLGEPDWSGSG